MDFIITSKSRMIMITISTKQIILRNGNEKDNEVRSCSSANESEWNEWRNTHIGQNQSMLFLYKKIKHIIIIYR